MEQDYSLFQMELNILSELYHEASSIIVQFIQLIHSNFEPHRRLREQLWASETSSFGEVAHSDAATSGLLQSRPIQLVKW